MSYINGEFEHPDYEIKIEVLEPTKDEMSYSEGMKIVVDWDSFLNTSLEDFREILKWMNEKADYIEKTFNKKGQIKQIRVKG